MTYTEQEVSVPSEEMFVLTTMAVSFLSDDVDKFEFEYITGHDTRSALRFPQTSSPSDTERHRFKISK
jgi:hypothetical protein